jgi:hypothetical protein
MDNGSSLMLTVLVSAIGTGYIVYGKKQRRGIALLSGIIMCIYPYLVDSPVWMILIGAVLMIAPLILQF